TGSEECDDGNQVNDDNCTNECRSARCGDGIRQGTEQCDDGNEVNDDSCSNTCRSQAVQMATGYYHTCFVKAGRVYCSGYGTYGQMGNGTNTSTNTSLQTVRNLTNVTGIASGNYHNCAVKSDGTVWCWGYNRQGQLGDGSTSNRNTPVQVRGITDASKITAGAYHSCALRRGGTMKCWGYNPFGQLGDGSGSQRNTPVDVRGISNATQISSGYYHTCARLSNSQFKCWGYGWYHNVTNTSNRSSSYRTPVTVSGATGEEINAHAWGACYRRSNGTVGCFGYGCHGQMGNGQASCYNYGNRTVSGISNAVQLGGGYYHVCARLQTGQIKCWGYNAQGQLGDGSTSNRSTPVTVQGISNSLFISDGPSSWHTCSSNSDGTTKCWGRGSFGAIGTGNTSNQNTPQTLGGVLAANNGGGGGGGGGNANLNADLGTIAHCGYGQARRSPGARLERVGIYNSRNQPLQRHNGHTNWDSFCRANGWEASNSGRGNWNHDCTRVMTYWSQGNVIDGRGGHRSTNYPPNRGAGSHIYMTCIGGQDNLNTGAGRLNTGRRHRLSTQFSGGHSNFHPQGMCYDNTRNHLVFAHQGSRRALTRANVSGTPIRELNRISTGLHHTTSVACDSNQFYLADYTGNASYQDMYTLSLTGSRRNFWSARAGYGGFPIAVYGNDMYRTALSNTYNWNNLTRIYRTDKSNPSTVRNSFATPGPVGDMCHDGTRIWALRYVHNRESNQISLWGFNPSNGSRTQTYNNITTCTRGQPKGLGCHRSANKLYVWCYEENSGTEGEIVEFNIGR
ncbi:MAG: DUF4215 domain-containing protein, partial [Myxococcota bacterium]|nr:DUF4215 domain-containing protein [Myxococcota bacterium]